MPGSFWVRIAEVPLLTWEDVCCDARI